MKTQTMYENIANSLIVSKLGHKACVTSCLSAQNVKEADISTNQLIMSNVTVNKSEGLFLNGTVVKKAINKVGVLAHLDEAQQCVVKKFRQEIEASKLIADAYAWFTSKKSEAQRTKYAIKWTKEEFGQKAYGLSKAQFYKKDALGKTDFEVVEGFITADTLLRMKGLKHSLSIEACNKFTNQYVVKDVTKMTKKERINHMSDAIAKYVSDVEKGKVSKAKAKGKADAKDKANGSKNRITVSMSKYGGDKGMSLNIDKDGKLQAMTPNVDKKMATKLITDLAKAFKDAGIFADGKVPSEVKAILETVKL